MPKSSSSPLISIVIPTYKRPDKLINAILSVKKQSFEDWIIIIVDDNCPSSEERKATEKVMKKHSEDNQVVYLKHNKNLGACTARNTGISNAKSKYIAFLDDDDIWREDKLEKQIKALREFGADFCYSDMNLIYNNKIKYFKSNSSKDLYKSLLLQGFGICTSALIISMESIKSIGGFDKELPSMQDYDLLLRLSKNFKHVYISEPLLTYKLDDDGISCNPYHKAAGHRAIIEKHKEEYLRLKLKTGLSRQYESLADFELRCGHRGKAITNYFKSLSLKLFNPRVLIKLVSGTIFGKMLLEAFLKWRQQKTAKNIIY